MLSYQSKIFSLTAYEGPRGQHIYITRFRPHRMLSAHAAYCYRRRSVVCLHVSVLITTLSPPETAEPIEMPLGAYRYGPEKPRGAQTNTTDRSVRDDASCRLPLL